jgi:hypothetical protein
VAADADTAPKRLIQRRPRRSTQFELRQSGAAASGALLRCTRSLPMRAMIMATPDIMLIAAAALSTLVIWLGVIVQGRIAAALAKP